MSSTPAWFSWMLVGGILLASLTCVRLTTSVVDLMVRRPSLFGISMLAEINLSLVGRDRLVAVLEAQMVLWLLFLLLLEVHLLPLLQSTRRLVVLSLLVLGTTLTCSHR